MNPMQRAQTRWGGILAAGIFTLCGCSRSAPAPAPESTAAANPPTPPAKSTTDIVVDGITGRTAIQAGQKARATVDKVNAKREADMAEVDNF